MGNLLKQLKEARNFPINTCPRSRHVEMIAEKLFKGKVFHILNEEPKHCAESMLCTVKSLYLERTKNIKLKKQLAEAQNDKADAERYRWLRDNEDSTTMLEQLSVVTYKDWNEAIDQRMKKNND